MVFIATIFLVLSLLLAAASIGAFPWKFLAARLLLLCANALAAVGALEVAMTTPIEGLATWAILFAGGAFSCGTIALRQLKGRPIRWVHRYVIYAGYAATFAAMAIAALWLHARDATRAVGIGVLFGIYLAGSACIFIAKTLIVRSMIKRMPEYAESLTASPQQYW
jgi:hypothetical protein